MLVSRVVIVHFLNLFIILVSIIINVICTHTRINQTLYPFTFSEMHTASLAYAHACSMRSVNN
nr:hypothetical protein Iba_chr09aCG9980 [Ipomoea batatas]